LQWGIHGSTPQEPIIDKEAVLEICGDFVGGNLLQQFFFDLLQQFFFDFRPRKTVLRPGMRERKRETDIERP